MFSLRKNFRKTKIIEDQGSKPVDALKVLKPDAQQLTITDEVDRSTKHKIN